ncbi:MAG: hypothetical protein ACXVA9_05560 [Bdellovibrionales bacterium]
MYIDAYALISQQDGDVGDSLHREGMYAFGKWLLYDRKNNTVAINEIPQRRDPAQIIDKFETAPGIYVRHPDPTRWSSNPDTTSRDQLVPVIAYCGAYQDYPRLWRLFKATAARGFFAQNVLDTGEDETVRKVPDTMIGHLGLFIRAGGWWTAVLYPLLIVTDSADLIATILESVPVHWEESGKRLRTRDLGDVDDNNAIIAHLLAVKFKPTPISWLNRQLYSFLRPLNYGNTKLGESNHVMGALAWYHRKEAGGNEEIAELYRPMIEEYFSPQDSYSHVALMVTSLYDHYTGRILTTAL